MIILFQVADHCYTDVIKKFLDDKALFDLAYYNSEEDLKQFRKDIDDTNVIKYQSKTTVHEKSDIQKRMLKTIQQTFSNYINSKDEIIHKQHILKSTIIKVVNLIMDINFNNERIYYIECIDKYIIM